MTSATISAYRTLLREFARSSIVPRQARNKNLQARLREIFMTAKGADALTADATSAALFLHSQRMHQILLERYNPTHGMTTQERHTATARRVGLDMPVEHRPE